MGLPPPSVMLGALIIYIALVILAGYFYGKMPRKTEEEYLVAGRVTGWIGNAFSMMATIASGGVYLGTVGLFYSLGVNLATYAFAFVGVSPILLWVVGKRLWKVGKEYGYSTPEDFYADRYNSQFLRIAGAIGSLIFLVPYFASSAVACGILFELFLGLPYSAGVIAVLGICLAYTMYGGMRSVIYTDVVQGAILLAVGFISIFILWGIAGGYSAVVTAVPTTVYRPTVASYALYVGWLFFMALHPITLADRNTRMYAIAGIPQLKRMCILSSVLLLIMSTNFLCLGLVSRVLTPGAAIGEVADNAFVLTIKNFLPEMAPFLLIAVWACGMSTIDSGLIGSSAIFSKDLLRKWLKKDITDEKMVLAGRLVLIPLMIFSAWVAIARPPSIWYLIGMTVSFFIQFAPMLIGGLYMKRANKLAAEASWIVAMFFVILFQFFVKPPLGVWGGIWALIPNTILFIALSYLTKPMPDQHLEKFWRLFK
jgi:Na+/proline symporter